MEPTLDQETFMNDEKIAKLREDLESKGFISTQLDIRPPLAEAIIDAFAESKQSRLPEFLRQALTRIFLISEVAADRQSSNELAVAVGQVATVSSNNIENE